MVAASGTTGSKAVGRLAPSPTGVLHLGNARTELLFENGLNLFKRERRNTVLQCRQLGHPAGRKDVRTGGEQLAQLDEG